MSDIGANLERVRERIARAAERSGRRGDDVLLIGVSKTVEVERIQHAVAAGVPALGENRVQEAKEKVAALGRPVPWHLIGHLQTNKVREALELDAIAKLDHIHVRGLMTIPPIAERAEDARGWFRALAQLGKRVGLAELSMGMSADFEVALEEGATMVRVGTAIFGPRPAKATP
ncbi:MAG: hypothetical protein AUG80_08855 [Candidatus Rokubacteria bacterium 13_1_20CM_4_68_9]|nr:MAG: hypothetical protein AUG80_08855 [Candidatus Rokubacteria bacterium 13_1_20CM_4_68_9]